MPITLAIQDRFSIANTLRSTGSYRQDPDAHEQKADAEKVLSFDHET